MAMYPGPAEASAHGVSKLSLHAVSTFELPVSQVDVWLVPASADVAALEQLAGTWLSAAERTRLDSRRLPKGRAMFLLTRAVLRRLLSVYRPGVKPEEWQLGRSAEGRPCVLGPVAAPVFNLSHTDDMLVLAFAASGAPGVDIESLGRQLDASGLAQRFFSNAEFQALQGLPLAQQRDRFLRLWTLKEACVKANGLGLARALRDFEFRFGASADLMFYPVPREAPPHQHWRLWSTTLAGLRIALALRCQANPGNIQLCVRQLTWPDQVSVIECVPEYQGTT